MATALRSVLHPGGDDLEVVGEASHQDALWAICGGSSGQKIRFPVVAVLVPEPHNPHDANAIAVRIKSHLVGYLSRENAILYRPGLEGLMGRCGAHVALSGVIVGGGFYPDGPGRLGVWLEHDLTSFGLPSAAARGWSGPTRRQTPGTGTMRTGFSEAWLTDAEDDSYDLSWFDGLSSSDGVAINQLRRLLESDPDPIDRHFQFAELECRLYKCRDAFPTALDDFDAVCARHDAEMETICAAFRTKWGKVPLLETYKQMAVRRQKQKDWTGMLWWAERGLTLYGNDAARQDAVEDLLKRRNRALGKLEAVSAVT